LGQPGALTEEKITKIDNDTSSNIHFIPESSSSVSSEDNEEGISESSHYLDQPGFSETS
jgi:hypothetical protein